MESEAQSKDGERQEEEVTEEEKRFTVQEMVRRFSLFEGATLIFEAKDPNVEWHTKVTAAFQNVIHCSRVIYDEEKNKKPSIQTLLDRFFKRVDGTESCKEFCAINIRHSWNFSLPSLPYRWWSFSSTISHLLCLLLPAHSMPAPVG